MAVDTQVTPTQVAEPPARQSLGRLILGGTSALGVATVVERGLGFLANLLAARIGGAQVFGAYSVALTTANNVASYAGAGIGTTANRFSGEHPYGHPGYRGLLRALALISLGSAALAVVVLWFAAEPLATHLLRNPGLAHLLRLAAVSAGAILLLECLRGLLVGQRRFAALLTLCVLAGGGLLAVLPVAARHGASAMVAGQAAVALTAVLLCIVFARTLRFAPTGDPGKAAGPRPGAIVKFGAVQLASMIGINAAGWWTASLVARGDISLLQMGLYSVAVQMRNICMMPPSLISQTAYAQLTEEGGKNYGGPGRVTILSTMAATVMSLLICGLATALMPWLVPHLYGKSYASAGLAATLAVATGLVHMSNAPAAARLTVVSLRLAGMINGVWTVLILAVGTWVIRGGGAVEATTTFLAAHLLSALLVIITLLRLRAVPRELAAVSVPAFAGSILLAVLGWLRSLGHHELALSGSMIAATGFLVWVCFSLGSKASAGTFTLSNFVSGISGRAGLR